MGWQLNWQSTASFGSSLCLQERKSTVTAVVWVTVRGGCGVAPFSESTWRSGIKLIKFKKISILIRLRWWWLEYNTNSRESVWVMFRSSRSVVDDIFTPVCIQMWWWWDRDWQIFLEAFVYAQWSIFKYCSKVLTIFTVYTSTYSRTRYLEYITPLCLWSILGETPHMSLFLCTDLALPYTLNGSFKRCLKNVSFVLQIPCP